MIKQPKRIEMEDLKRILNAEIKLYGTMQTALESKKDVIIQGDLDALVRIDTDLENCAQQVRELEHERLALMVSIGAEGKPLRDFIACLESGEDAQLLSQSRTTLLSATDSIKKLSRTNRDLLTQSIRFIEQSVEVIASILVPEGASYGQAGTLKNGNSQSANSDTPIMTSTVCRDA